MISSAAVGTPLEHYPVLAKTIGMRDIFFKREDLHPYESHKGRSIPLMIDHYLKAGDNKFAISSSGNAALAACLHASKIGIELDVFVGRHVNKKKLDKLKKIESQSPDGNIRILSKERPLMALSDAVKEGYRSLRQSTDDTSLIGYKSLAEELASLKDIGAVFIGTSSGTTAQALAEYFIDKNKKIQVHIVQTSSCHPISDAFETYDGNSDKSIADAIVDQTALRKSRLVQLIQETGGHGWVATNDDILAARELSAEHTGIEISPNSALSVVGAMQAAYRGWEIPGITVCMICGD